MSDSSPDLDPADRRAAYEAAVTRRRAALVVAAAEIPAGATLEIGCGLGHWLVAYAESHPGIPCVGCDLLTRRVARAEHKRRKRGLEQVRFLKADAVELLLAWPEDRPIARTVVLFPDPWPKARHHKNRLIQPTFLSLLAQRSSPGAELHFRTDHRDYAEWARERLEAHADWDLREDLPWPFEAATWFADLLAERGHVSLSARRR